MLGHLIEAWASLYSNHPALRTAIEFTHIAGLVGGGGCAIAADRVTLRAARTDAATRAVQLRTLDGTHHVVTFGMIAMSVSGVLMFGADVDTFLYSKFFWLKMSLMALLLINGALLMRAEHGTERGDPDAWRQLLRTSRASVVLWSLTTLVGAALPNAG